MPEELYVPGEYVEDVAPETAFPPAYHWYEYDPEPPDADAVRVMDLPTSVGFWLDEIDTVGSVLTVCVRVPLWAVYPLVSVITTYTEFDPWEVKSSLHCEETLEITEFPLR